jgi:PPOX class probable FMN-dependent enzyme
VSPKGDQPGFVHVLDERHLVIPDRPGNKRLDGMKNLLQNPHVGLIFLIPGREETLRVNGRASIVRDEDVLVTLAARGKQPVLAIGVEVEECFFHCPKAFRRSGLWEPDAWPDRALLPSMACVLYEKLQPAGKTLEEYERESEESIQKTLY